MKSFLTPEVKLGYLIAVVLLLVAVPGPVTTVILLAVQAALWAISPVGWQSLARILKRLGIFFLVIGISYAFVSTGDALLDRWTDVTLGPWTVAINLAGIAAAVMMCVRVLVLVMASVWVQASGSPGDLVRALERFRVPTFIAASIDGTIQLASGGGGGMGGGGGRGQGRGGMEKRDKVAIDFEQLRHGNLTFITELVERGLDRAERFVTRANPDMEREQTKDIAIIVGMATAIMGTKLLQVLPGIPFAPGHKNVVIIPFLLLASRLTYRRFGGLWTGLTAGVVSVFLGYGQYGVLEIAQFAVPGLMADLFLPVVRPSHPKWLRFIEFGLIGGLLGIGRFAANVLVILLAGAPGMAFVLYLPMLASQVFFGAVSAFVSMAVLDLASRPAVVISTEAVAAPPRQEEDETRDGAHAGNGGGGGRHRRASS
ncbi:MAG: energy-coupling factor transporter transmembrane protein EcfT [Nitrospiraceae bacterium]